jgi:hypothetical protein
MNTNNIISTPNITGNIGSCETKKVESLVKGGLIKNETKVIMTNSCTGEIIQNYNYSNYTSFTTSFTPIGITMIFLIIYAIIKNDIISNIFQKDK